MKRPAELALTHAMSAVTVAEAHVPRWRGVPVHGMIFANSTMVSLRGRDVERMGIEVGVTRMDHHGPGWAALAEDYLPCTVAVDAVIGQSEAVVVFLSGFRVFPTGVSMRLSVRLRDGQGSAAERRMITDVFDDSWARFPTADADPTRLTWWLQFSDGRVAYGVDAAVRDELHAADAADAGPSRPVLVGGGGEGVGGPLSVERDFWLWPLPTPGALRVQCSWPALAVAPSVVELDADALLQAAARARPLW